MGRSAPPVLLQTEGQVTKLKLVKHRIYGRAKFDLLRQRVLYRAA
jgi:transposase